MTKDMTQGNPLKLILAFAVPLMLGSLFQQFYNLADTIIVGRFVGVEALAAVGSVGGLNYLVLGFVNGIACGFSIPISWTFGAKDYVEMRRYTANAVWLSVFFAAVLTVVTVAMTRSILVWTNTPDNIIDLFGAVVEQSEEDAAAELLVKVTTSRPVFDYASIQAEITDADMTFEQLRVKMSADCPELEARAHVSWSLSYAGFSERITDVNSTIYDAKSKMEQSKKFKDALKKRKPADKLPVCSVKPTVTAQKKGILPFPAYKAVCESVEAAEQANVPICYIPSQNGQIYEMRRNEIGTFIAPSSKIVELDMIRAGFQMNLPRLPAAKLAEIISFFRRVCAAHDRCMEALVNVYWDRVEQEYILHVLTQQATAVSVETDLSDRPDESRYYLVMEVHSHKQ